MSMLNVKIYISNIRHLSFTVYISVSSKPLKTLFFEGLEETEI